MKIVVLVDNVSSGLGHKKRASISFYIETKKHNILFDLGSNNLFLANAEKKSVDIEKVDTLILSSGFADQGGGLKDFFKNNTNAAVYVQQNAFNPYYTQKMGVKRYCGLDASLKGSLKITFTNNLYFLDDNMQLLSNVAGQRYQLENREKYYIKTEEGYEPAVFNHEQYLIFEENGQSFLFIGCPNNDVAGIIKKAESIYNRELDYVFTGFHMLDAFIKKDENAQQVNEMLKELYGKRTEYYTSELVGKETRDLLTDTLKDKIHFFGQGDVITF